MSVLDELFQGASAVVEETFDILGNNHTNVSVLIHDYLENMDLTTTIAPVTFPSSPWNIFLVVTVALLSFTALLVHSGIFLGIIISPLRITGYDVLIANMCLINMGILVLVAPEALTASLVYSNKWPLGAPFCHAWNFFRAFYTVASGWNLTALSLHQLTSLIFLLSAGRPFVTISGNLQLLVLRLAKLFLPTLAVWLISCGIEITFIEIEPQLYQEMCTLGDSHSKSLDKFILAEQIVSFWIPSVISMLTLVCVLAAVPILWRSRLAEAFKVRHRTLHRVLYSRRSWEAFGDYDTSQLITRDEVMEPHGHLALSSEDPEAAIKRADTNPNGRPQVDPNEEPEPKEITKQTLLTWGLLVTVHFACIASLYILYLVDFHEYLETHEHMTNYFRATLCIWAVKFLVLDPLVLVVSTNRYRTKVVTACRRVCGHTGAQ